MRLLIVEDSESLRMSLTEGLGRSGYAVDSVGDGLAGLQYAENTDYDVIILDMNLPGLDGMEVLGRLRRAGRSARVLILSARDLVQDRVDGLHAGADDYLVKPFSFDELLARLKALVRREYRQSDPEIRIGAVVINTALHDAWVDGVSLSLTRHEMSLLELLVLNKGRVLSAEMLEARLYSHGQQVYRNTIEVHISKVRRKLRDAGAGDIIKTRRGFGYFIDAG